MQQWKQGGFDLWQAFNPLSVQVGLAYWAFAVIAASNHNYAAIKKIEDSEAVLEEENAA